MEEEAKAVQEVFKTTGKAIDAGREVGGFLSRFVAGPLDQCMGIVEDKLKYLRWERQERLMDKANKFLAERGLSEPTRPVPLQIAIPVMQGGSLEENDDLQDRWAALLVNAADASFTHEIRRAYVSILEDLTPLDAQVLDKIYPVDKEVNPSLGIQRYKFLGDHSELEHWIHGGHEHPWPIQLMHEEVKISLGNLARLGLVMPAIRTSPY